MQDRLQILFHDIVRCVSIDQDAADIIKDVLLETQGSRKQHIYRYGATPQTINLDLKKTKFDNWGIGICFDNQNPIDKGTIMVNTNCYSFSNAIHKEYDWGSGTEHCP